MRPQTYALSQPKLFQFEYLAGAPCRGLDPEWYRDPWQRRAGCGPTTAATLMAYLARTHPALAPLAPQTLSTARDILPYMEAVWQRVTPTSMGLHTLDLFIHGSQTFGEDQGIQLHYRSLPIPGTKKGARPSLAQCAAFIRKALEADCPVAFLNYSSGALSNLDSWHWVTLIALSPRKTVAVRAPSWTRERSTPLILPYGTGLAVWAVDWSPSIPPRRHKNPPTGVPSVCTGPARGFFVALISLRAFHSWRCGQGRWRGRPRCNRNPRPGPHRRQQ